MTTEKLDPYAPDPKTIAGVKSQLLNAGVPAETIPQEWLPAIIAATAKWVQTTEDGLAFASRLLHFELTRGEDDKSYKVVNDFTGKEYTANPQDVWFYCGYIVDKKPIPAAMLNISESVRSQCEDCGIVSHCLKQIRYPGTDKLMELCNFCVTYHEHPRVNDEAGDCASCTVEGCQHHPHKKR